MTNLLFVQIILTVPEDENEDDTPLVQPASKEEALKRESFAIRRVPTTATKKKWTSSLGEIRPPHRNKMCQEPRVSDLKTSVHCTDQKENNSLLERFLTFTSMW